MSYPGRAEGLVNMIYTDNKEKKKRKKKQMKEDVKERKEKNRSKE